MSPDDIDLVRQSVADIADRGDEVVADFYRCLFDRAPETRALFGDDPAAQRAKFFDTLTEVVAALTDLAELATRARDLGSRHRGYGVHARHYDVVRDALLDTLAAALGDRFTDGHRSAWERGWTLIAELMQQGAAADQPPPRLADRHERSAQ